MSVNSTRNTILHQSFEVAALAPSLKLDALKIPVAANTVEEAYPNDSIFRTADK